MDQVEIVNLVPKFLTFYEKASEPGVDEETRWKLWQELYSFAAVPPGEKGRNIARKLLNEAWEQYAMHLPVIRNWEPNKKHVQEMLIKVKNVLDCKEQIELTVIYFVGGFENNPFVAPFADGRIGLCLPIECGDSDIKLAHELTHIVHAKDAQLSVTWERSIASVIIQEGLATHVSKLVVPGETDEAYIELQAGWLAACEARREDIFKGIFPFLNDATSEKVFQFTMGTGTTGNEREAYFVGWELLKQLQIKGITLSEIAKVLEADIPSYVQDNYSMLIEI